MRLGLTAIGVGALAVGAITACQTYDFEPVEPLALAQRTEKKVVVARKLKPNLMLVVDKSGSMLDPIESGSSVTRLDEMKTAMGGFLTNNGAIGRFGLAVFPDAADLATQCREGKVVHQVVTSDDVTTELQGAAAQINDTIQQIGETGGMEARGGTPTAATLRALANVPALQQADERDDIVILLTDGLPNCNSGLDGQNCTCTSGSATCGNSSCLDSAASVQAINDLKAKQISTIVIGFGADTGASLGRDALNAMAQAGGYARTCEKGCGGDTCDTASGFCNPKFYQASNAAALTAVLAELSNIFGDVNPCEYTFVDTTPTDPSFVVVYIDGQKVERGADTWNYSTPDGIATVTFTGDICRRLESATPSSPVDLEIRLLQAL